MRQKSLMKLHLIPSTLKSINLCHGPGVGLCFDFYLRQEIILIWVPRVTEDMSLGVIFMCSISRIILIGFLLLPSPLYLFIALYSIIYSLGNIPPPSTLSPFLITQTL